MKMVHLNRLLLRFLFFLTISPNRANISDIHQQTKIDDSYHYSQFYQQFEARITLRVCAVQYPPIMWINKDVNGKVIGHRGFNSMMFDYLSDATKMSYIFVDVSDEAVIKYGAFPACARLLLDQEVDLISMPSIPHSGSLRVMDIIQTPLLVAHYRIIVPWPREKTRFLNIIRPFQPTVWVCLLLLFLVMMPALKYLRIASHKIDPSSGPKKLLLKPQSSLVDYGVYLIIILFSHGDWTRMKKISFRIALGAWCLAAVVLANAYGSTLVSFLTVSELEPIINSWEELANNNPTLKLLTEENSPSVKIIFLDAENGTFKALGDMIRSNPESRYKTLSQVIQKMDTMNYALPTPDLISYPLIDSTFKAAGGKCRFTLSKPLSEPTLSYHYHAAKNRMFTEIITGKIQTLRETGILDFWIKSSMPRIDHCLLEKREKKSPSDKGKFKRLNLTDLSSGFAILGVGLLLSLLVYILELVHTNCKLK